MSGRMPSVPYAAAKVRSCFGIAKLSRAAFAFCFRRSGRDAGASCPACLVGALFKKNGPGDVFRESKLYYFCRRKNKGTV